jgi:hypothetical protein
MVLGQDGVAVRGHEGQGRDLSELVLLARCRTTPKFHDKIVGADFSGEFLSHKSDAKPVLRGGLSRHRKALPRSVCSKAASPLPTPSPAIDTYIKFGGL